MEAILEHEEGQVVRLQEAIRRMQGGGVAWSSRLAKVVWPGGRSSVYQYTLPDM